MSRVDEYINERWSEERLNVEFSYYTGWHEAIKGIIKEVWKYKEDQRIKDLKDVYNEIDRIDKKLRGE